MKKMKLKFLAGAIAGAVLCISSGSAMAQSTVTLFGLVSLALTKSTGSSTGIDTTGFGNGFGFKGSEELGGGLEAFFHLETRFDADTGKAKPTFFDEKSIVGLRGGFGTVQLGRSANPFDAAKGKGDPFGETVANIGNESLLGEDKHNNSIYYLSPQVGGASFGVSTAAKETAASNISGTAYVRRPFAANFNYINGPLDMGVGYVRNGANTSNSATISGNYDLSVAKLYAGYTRSSEIAAGAGKASNGEFGVSVPLGAGDLKAAYSRTKNLNQADGTTADTLSKVGLGYWYRLSKRTMLFTDVARNTSKSGATKTNGNAFDLGILHTF
ncbi:MAG: hypothetical protein JWR60_1517 [Polaromonas sp.]|nr:hypothetical protein [Polaromonas sp.]